MKLLTSAKAQPEPRQTAQPKRVIRVSDAMAKGIVTLAPEDSFDAALELIADRDCHFIPVTDDANKVLGLLSQNDIVGSRLDFSEWHTKPVKDAMRPNPKTVTFRTPLWEAITEMLTERLECLPVTNDAGVLCGMLTSVDIMRAHLQSLTKPEEEIDVER